MKRRMDICHRKTFKDLDKALYDFGQTCREKIHRNVEQIGRLKEPSEEEAVVFTWAVALAIMAFEVGGSCFTLLAHGDLRAPVILNRCIFEYVTRLRYYVNVPYKAAEAISQLPERLRKIYRADPSLRHPEYATNEKKARMDSWLQESVKIVRENFKDQVLKTVEPELYQRYYDGFYGKASAYVHGYETILRDVFRDQYVTGAGAPSLKSAVLHADDTAAVCIHQLVELITVLGVLLNQEAEAEIFVNSWLELQKQTGLSKREWSGVTDR